MVPFLMRGHIYIIYNRPHDRALWQIAGPWARLRVLLVGYRPEAKPRANILPVTPETEAKGLLSAVEPNQEVYIRYILWFDTIAAILRMRSINLMVGAWQKGQITWISDLWLVVGHATILIDLAASLIYVTSIYIYNLFIYTHTHTSNSWFWVKWHNLFHCIMFGYSFIEIKNIQL